MDERADIVERVARAMRCAQLGHDEEDVWRGIHQPQRDRWLAMARAAIAEYDRLRSSPTWSEAIEAAAKVAEGSAGDGEGYYGLGKEDAAKEIAERIRALTPPADGGSLSPRGDKSDEIRIAELEAELDQWRECARYDPMMSGTPAFKGWDRSALDRLRHKFEAERRAALEKDTQENKDG